MQSTSFYLLSSNGVSPFLSDLSTGPHSGSLPTAASHPEACYRGRGAGGHWTNFTAPSPYWLSARAPIPLPPLTHITSPHPIPHPGYFISVIPQTPSLWGHLLVQGLQKAASEP